MWVFKHFVITARSIKSSRKRLKIPNLICRDEMLALCKDHCPFSFAQSLCPQQREEFSSCHIWLWRQSMAVCDAAVPKTSVAVGREGCKGNQSCGKSLLEKVEGMPTTTKCYRLCFQDFRRGLRILRAVTSHLVTAANREWLRVSAGFESFGRSLFWLSCSAESRSVQLHLLRERVLTFEPISDSNTNNMFSLIMCSLFPPHHLLFVFSKNANCGGKISLLRHG